MHIIDFRKKKADVLKKNIKQIDIHVFSCCYLNQERKQKEIFFFSTDTMQENMQATCLEGGEFIAFLKLLGSLGDSCGE